MVVIVGGMKTEIYSFNRGGMTKLKWSDLDSASQKWIIGMVAYEALEKLVTWHFIYHTPKAKTRGSKWMWFGLSFINFLGPAAYALWGRKR